MRVHGKDWLGPVPATRCATCFTHGRRSADSVRRRTSMRASGSGSGKHNAPVGSRGRWPFTRHGCHQPEEHSYDAK